MNAQENINNIIALIDKTTNLFYQNRVNEGYNELEQLINCIITSIDDINREYAINPNENDILSILKTAMCAMEQRDTLLLADILEYDLKEKYLELKNR